MVLFLDICVNGNDNQCHPLPNAPAPLDADRSIDSTFDLSPLSAFNPTSNPSSLQNYFLCFAQVTAPAPICDAWSPVFELMDSAIPQTSTAPASSHTYASSMSVTSTNNALLSVVTPVAVSNGAATSSSGATFTSILFVPGSPTVVTTITPTPTGTAESAGVSVSHSKPALSTGALVGIIVGAVSGALIAALLGLFCLRHRKRHPRSTQRSNILDSHGSQPEHVLLSQPYSFSSTRDPTAEKASSPTTIESILDAPLARPVLPTNPRHSYDSVNAFAPYSGSAAAVPKPRPRPPSHPPASPSIAQQTHSHPQSEPQTLSLLTHIIPTGSLALTRGISDASGPISPRSTIRSEEEDFETYHDVEPIYGDARHTPTLFQTSISSSSLPQPYTQMPFLSEEGLSAEEVARLMEEERRIDEAIAAKEGRMR